MLNFAKTGGMRIVGRKKFTKEEIESAFHEIGRRALADGHVVELSVTAGRRSCLLTRNAK